MRLKLCIERIRSKIKFGFQRMFRGYDDSALWCIHGYFVDEYMKILKDFRANLHGYPGYMESIEEWEDILDAMIHHLTFMSEDLYFKDEYSNWSYRDIDKSMEYHKEEFFKLFTKYFYHLWD